MFYSIKLLLTFIKERLLFVDTFNEEFGRWFAAMLFEDELFERDLY